MDSTPFWKPIFAPLAGVSLLKLDYYEHKNFPFSQSPNFPLFHMLMQIILPSLQFY